MDSLNSLDVAIGLIFVFLVVSLIVTAINEWIAQLLALRSKTLKEGLQQLLSDENRDLAAELYAHPLIKSLAHQGRFDRLIKRPAAPSYIPARVFSTALFDTVVGPGTSGRHRTVAEIRDAVANLPDGSTKANLQAILNEVGTGTGAARKAIEQWFDDAMDRVSGQYKRRIQIVTIALAFLITVLANVDSFAVTDHLVRNPATLAAIVALAEKTATDDALATALADPTGGTTPDASAGAGGDTSNATAVASPGVTEVVGTTGADGDTGLSADASQASPDDAEFNLPKEQIEQIDQIVAQTMALQLPLGWAEPERPEDSAGWGAKVLGLVITAAAVSLGAPFWFDMLSKVVRIRTTGPRPEEANPTVGKT